MTHNLLVVGLDDRIFSFTVEENVQAVALKGWLAQKQGVGANCHLTLEGAPLVDTDIIPCAQEWGTTLIRAHPIIKGGKGGFGALIRAVGNRNNRGNNKEACRDLSGRRLRDINAQKKVSKWLEEEPERKKRLREEKRKRLQQKRRVQPKHFFDDQAYMQQLRANEEDMDDALKQGLVASSSKGVKRKQPESGAGPSGLKKAKLWVGVEDEDISSEDDSEEEYTSRDSDGYVSRESGGSNTEQCPPLDSAGSSNEAVRGSKASAEEGEEVESMEEGSPGPNGSRSTSTVVTAEIQAQPSDEERKNQEHDGDDDDGGCEVTKPEAETIHKQTEGISDECEGGSTTALSAEVQSPPSAEEQKNQEQNSAGCTASKPEVESIQEKPTEVVDESGSRKEKEDAQPASSTHHEMEDAQPASSTHHEKEDTQPASSTHHEKEDAQPASSAHHEMEDAQPASSAHHEMEDTQPASSAHHEKEDAQPASSAHHEKEDAPPASSTHHEKEDAQPASSAHHEMEDAQPASSAHHEMEDTQPASSAHHEKEDAQPASSAHHEKEDAPPASSAHHEKEDAQPASSTHHHESDEQAQSSPKKPLNLEDYSSVTELESVGAEQLKLVLQAMGLKCGGTLQERAQRLFSTKGKSLEELDSSLFAKASKSRKRRNK